METLAWWNNNLRLFHMVRNPLLSERDGNLADPTYWNSENLTSQKPTTLWKRWKPYDDCRNRQYRWKMSETHYSLKEMETSSGFFQMNLPCHKSETHYSLKEMETIAVQFLLVTSITPGQKPTTLWKRWKLIRKYLSKLCLCLCQKPTTLWKRWKLSRLRSHLTKTNNEVGNPLLSERDGNKFFMCLLAQGTCQVGNPLLSERDGSKRKKGWEWTQP